MIDRLALALLIAGCILFAGILAAEVIETPPGTETIAANTPPRGETVSAAARTEPGVQPGGMVAQILARPLFSSTRRPSLHTSDPAGDAGLSDTRLTGIVTEPGHRFAIFAITGAKPLIVTEGDTVGGWHVDNITPREVSLSGPEGTKTLQPKIDPNLVPPPPPPVPAASSAAARPAGAIGPRAPVRPLLPNRPPLRPGQWPVRQ
jgi:hypothetical protein